jgi:hypothetical protein
MLGFSDIRAAISTKINTLAGMKLSRFPPEMITRGPAPISHLAYSIGIETVSERGGRQIPSKSVELSSQILIIFAYRMKPTSLYPSSYDLALTQEQNVILKVLESYQGITNEMEIQFNQSTREIVDSGEYSIHRLIFTIQHHIKQ